MLLSIYDGQWITAALSGLEEYVLSFALVTVAELDEGGQEIVGQLGDVAAALHGHCEDIVHIAHPRQ